MIRLIKGGEAVDHRGKIRFVNDFDLTLIKRFYIISNRDTTFFRGWRGHSIEQRWFYVLIGRFELYTVKIDDWSSPSPDLPVDMKYISADDLNVLHLPRGYATAFRSTEENSELLVFADHSLEHAVEDDFTWGIDYFKNI